MADSENKITVATFEQIADVLSHLATNYTNTAVTYFTMFYDPTPQDVTLQLYDESGNLQEYVVPNRAKDFNFTRNGEGSPEGVITANVGTTYQDTLNGVLYIKKSGTQAEGWEEIGKEGGIERGEGSPIGRISRSKGSLYVDINSAALYIKGTSTGNQDWYLVSPNTESLANRDLSNLTTEGNNKFLNRSLGNLDAIGQGILNTKESTNNKVYVVNEYGTNDQYASAKAVYDFVSGSYADKSLSNLNALGENKFSNKDLSNLSSVGLNKFANPDLSNLSQEGELKLKAPALEVGDIGISLFVDESKGLRRYLNGTLLAINTHTTPFLNRLKTIAASYPSIVCTEEEWQTISNVSVGGQCGKFVIDEVEGTIRLPKIVMPIQGLTNLLNLGEMVQAGLPNITGSIGFSGIDPNTWWGSASGVFTQSNNWGAGDDHAGSVNGGAITFGLNASRSSSIYKNGFTTVQQEQIQYPYFIQIANGRETVVDIIDTLELNNPYSMFDCKYTDKTLSNLSWLKSNGQWNNKSTYVKAYECLQIEYNTEIEVGETTTLPSGTTYVKQGVSVKLSTETYTDYDFVLNTTAETFRLPIKSKLASGKAIVGNGMTLGFTDGNNNYGMSLTGNTENTCILHTPDYNQSLPSNNTTGYAVGVPSASARLGITTDPTKSGIELSDSNLNLYFYVGETVQNANLINAGRVSELLVRPSIIDEWHSGTEGYRVWSNGYCEQWGRQVAQGQAVNVLIQFVKNFKDTNYHISATASDIASGYPDTSSQVDGTEIGWGRLHTNSMSVGLNTGYTTQQAISWKVCGYLAEGQY